MLLFAFVVSVPLGIGGAGLISLFELDRPAGMPTRMRSRVLASVAVAFLGLDADRVADHRVDRRSHRGRMESWPMAAFFRLCSSVVRGRDAHPTHAPVQISATLEPVKSQRSILWFRRDLRLTAHPALQRAADNREVTPAVCALIRS